MANNRLKPTLVLLTCLLCWLSLPGRVNLWQFGDRPYGFAGEPQAIEDLSECTTGLASGLATPDGCPLLWKNRDIGNSLQEYHYVDHGGFPFIGLTYQNNDSNYFAGINSVGFGIENSDAHNLPGANASGPYDDGITMSLALSTCRTVDDFQALLDSLNERGRTYDFNYGTFDAFGGATMFECDGFRYTRFDAVDEVDGFMIRSNFAFSGNDTTNHDSDWGVHRHNRAYALWKDAAENNNLTPEYIYQQVVRDLASRGCDPYPLPFDGYYSDWMDYPYGHVPNETTINRYRTRSVFIGKGVPEGERPDDCIIWAMAGHPLGCIATPLWVRAGSVPVEYDDAGGSTLNHSAEALRAWITEAGSGVDTWRLTNPAGTGVYDFLLPIESYIFSKTERFLASPSFSYDRFAALQNEAAQEAADSIAVFRKVYNVTHDFELITEGNNIVLIWQDEREVRDFGERIPRGYNIYRSNHPFREGEAGDLIAFVEGTHFIDQTHPLGVGFYRVEVAY